MENKDNIYNQFKEASTKAEDKGFDRMDAVWNRVEEKLDNKKRRRGGAWFKYAGIAAALLLFMGIGSYMLNKNETLVTPQVTPQNNITVIDTTTVKETFTPETTETAAPIVVKHNVVATVKKPKEAVASTSIANTASPKLGKVAIGESITFTGIIYDETGLPIPGVTVTNKGAKIGIQTDFDGRYALETRVGDTLQISYIGMEDKSIVANDSKRPAIVTLKDNSQTLEAVVVESYRATTKARSSIASTTVTSQTIERRPDTKKGKKKSNATAEVAQGTTGIASASPTGDVHIGYNATTLASKTVENRPNASYLQTLQGQVSGVQVSTGNGQPSIKIRGVSLQKGTDPLVIMDGKIIDYQLLQKINPDYIKSIDVLKDATATSLYGSSATNGAIIIKTKKLNRKQKRELKKALQTDPATIQAIHNAAIDFANNKPVVTEQEEYDTFEENKFENPATTPLSTFSIDVDNASYTNIRRFINNGQTVPKDAVRVEEMINFFKYQYPQPEGKDPFSINTEYSDAPWNPNHKLLKIGLQGKDIPTVNLPASNFVFLIDVSGSMSDANKLPLLKQSMKLLVNQMRPKDKLAIVVYAGAAGLVLPPTSGSEKSKIIEALENLNAGGSTAGGEGIELAYKTAQENFVKGGNNRVILATDGDFNVGASSNADMQTLIEQKRKGGVFLTCLGYGMGNYKDSKLETLADKGNGNYAYIDNMQEATRFLDKEFKGSMYAIAKDVKIQIEFNPKLVQSYRLIGYENRKLRDEDFVNDAIDAGELGSGHTVTALYEIIPVGVKSDYTNATTELKYSIPQQQTDNYSNELATIKFRHKKPDSDKSTEIVKVIPNNAVKVNEASPDFKFAAAVAWFGLKLRDSKLIPNKTSANIKELAKKGLQNDPEGYRAEFLRLVEMVP